MNGQIVFRMELTEIRECIAHGYKTFKEYVMWKQANKLIKG